MSANRWLATGNYFTSYQDEQRLFFTHPGPHGILNFFVVLLFAWPLLFSLSNKYMLVVDNILIAVVAVIGLNLVTGFAGLISIGHAAFVGIGAYTVASFARTLGDSHVLITHAWPLMIVLAGLMGAVFGAIVGLPALRLKHLYLAIATLSLSDDFSWTINFLNFSTRADDLHWQGLLVHRQGGRKDHYLFWYYVLLWWWSFAVSRCTQPFEDPLRPLSGAVRDNDRAADAMGMHPGLTKVYAFGPGRLFCRCCREPCMPIFYRGVGFESFTLHHSITYLAMAIVGGLGTLHGSFWGPAAIITLELQVETIAEHAGRILPSDWNIATALKPLSFGLVIVLFLMFEPRGIANWWRIAKSYTKLWPFRY
jgi:branched-chain amino acid transport system permease protein